MYFPKTIDQLHDILDDLQRYAELEAMPELSEALSDAKIILAAETVGQKGRTEEPCPPPRESSS